jgi:hypothetical protein
MPLATLKKALLSLMVVGFISSVTAIRTDAILTDQIQNAGSTASTGTLTLETNWTDNAGANPQTCRSRDSTAVGNNTVTCAPMFTNATTWPGSTQTIRLTVTNTGSVPASALDMWMPSCTDGNTAGAPIQGLWGSPCGQDTFSIQETASDFSTPVQCWWPTRSLATCPALIDGTLGVFFSNYHAYPGDKLYSYASAPPQAVALGVGAANARYFLITVGLPADDTGALQGRSLLFPLQFHIES